MPIRDVVNSTEDSAEDEYMKEGSLASWVLALVQEWEDTRDTDNEGNWSRYERIWRGIFSDDDKTRKSERSKHISPALSQAIESIVAEIEESVFGQGRFFDVDPSLSNEQKEAVTALRDLLYEDMGRADIATSLSEIIHNGAIYGTGIGKLVIDTANSSYIVPKPYDGLPDVVQAGRQENEEVIVRFVPVHPYEFVIDDAAKNIQDALGMAHVTIVPMHKIKKRQKAGVYEDCDVAPYTGTIRLNPGVTTKSTPSNGVKIYEYHGLVPAAMLARQILGDDYDELFVDEEEAEDEDDMVEAIVTISDGGDLLRAIPNPNVLEDRNFLAFQFDTLPNQFYGRGVSEKGINAQMGLDKESRARHDALALTVHPMMAVDATQLPRGANVSVSPGRTILTTGRPADVLQPINFGSIDPAIFTSTADLERQVAKATGALDDAAMNPAHAKTGAMGLAMAGAIKRSRRSLANFERNIVNPMVHKMAARYMQFAPEKYPTVAQPKFKVHTSKGMVQKQMESQDLANMLKTVSPESPAYWMLLRGVFENSSIDDRDRYVALVEQNLEAAMNPQPSEMEIANMEATKAKLSIDRARARAELLRIEMEAQKLESGKLKDMTQAMLNVAKAEAEEAGTDIEKYNAVLQRIQAQFQLRQQAQLPTPAVPGVPEDGG